MITILAAAVLSAGIGAIAVPSAVATPAAPAVCQGRSCFDPPDPGDPGDPGTPPSDPGGGTTPPTTTTCSAPDVSTYNETTSYTPDCGTGFRLHANTVRIRWDKPPSGGPTRSARVQSYSRFEKTSNGDRVDVDYLRVACHDDYGGNDSDHEHDASKTTVTYNTPLIPFGARVIVTCEHQATYRGVNYSATTVTTYYAPTS